MEDFIYLAAPVCDKPAVGQEDISEKYFSFQTADPTNVIGYDVYYCIYSDKETLEQHVEEILSVKEHNPYNAFITLRDTQRFRCLCSSNSKSDSPLIKPMSNSVRIRLIDGLSGEKAAIEVDGNFIGEPKRYNDKFFKEEIKKDDPDVFSNDSSEKWLVVAYAVAVGLDSSIKQITSVPE